ncbi:hypothetical protein U1Q18_042312 [Sarracenia purpurea var. burkii]
MQSISFYSMYFTYTLDRDTSSDSDINSQDESFGLECAAESCESAKKAGRRYHKEGNRFELISCSKCKRGAIHWICANIGDDEEWICQRCAPEDMSLRQYVIQYELYSG